MAKVGSKVVDLLLFENQRSKRARIASSPASGLYVQCALSSFLARIDLLVDLL
jgi:hypothetical protein